VVRVTLDEAHSVFLCDTYRPKMQSMIHLREVTGQKVFLTATLAPCHEPVLLKSLGIPLPRTLLLRLPTARPNHRLQVVGLPTPEAVFPSGAQLATLLLEEWKEDPGARGIFFVRSLRDLQEFTDSCLFPVCTFYGNMTGEQKDEQLNSWFSKDHPSKWMVSTTALLHGVDYPQVNAVIFLGCPFGLYDFIQGAGRGGRGGQESLVAVLFNDIPTPLPNESPYCFREEMEKILITPSCRRRGISKTMDGEDLPCSLVPNSLLCDFCKGRLHPLVSQATSPLTIVPTLDLLSTPPSTPTEQSHRSDTHPLPTTPLPLPIASRPLPSTAAITRLGALTAQQKTDARVRHARSAMGLLEKMGGCFACRISSTSHNPCHSKCGLSSKTTCSKKPHLPFKCNNSASGMRWIDWKKRNFTWPTGVSRCHFCSLPNAVAGYHSNPNGKGCKFSDSAVVAAWHIFQTPHLFEQLRKDFGFSPGQDPEVDYAVWLTSYGADTEDVRILSVFTWLCRQWYPRLKL
jgi:hypothetical protein